MDWIRELHDSFELGINRIEKENKKAFVSSSFQSNSVVLLHLVSVIRPQIPIIFLNTGFLFPETFSFRNLLAERLGLNIIEYKSSVPKIQQRDTNGRFLYTTNPDACCRMNKVLPMQRVLEDFDVWINGVRAGQSSVRNSFAEWQTLGDGKFRYHPLLDLDNRAVHQYIKHFELPFHPLHNKGLQSIGCEPCTQIVPITSSERDGRWMGLNKTECGLHTEIK